MAEGNSIVTEEAKKVYRKKGEVVSRNVGGETILVPVMGTLK